MHNQIPLARGLGSSAAATVGGVLAGNALAGEPLSTAELLRLACEIEGHPDNAAAALLGGFVVSATDARRRRGDPLRLAARPARRPVHPRAPPADRRRCGPPCPTSVPLADAVANLGAVAVGVAGLATGRYDLLARLTVDRLHEPYRAAVYPQLPRLVEARAGRRRARGVPVGRRVDDPRLRRLDDRDHPDRGGVLRRGGRPRTCPAGSWSSSRATPARGSSPGPDGPGRHPDRDPSRRTPVS